MWDTVGKTAPVFGAISSVAGWVTKNQILDELKKHNVTITQIADGIDVALASQNIVLPQAQEVDFRKVNHLFVPARKALKTDIVASGFLRTPGKLREQFAQNPWDLLDTPTPIALVDLNRSPDWIPVLFEWENQLYVGWQKRGMLKSTAGLEVHFEPAAWVPTVARDQPSDHVLGSIHDLIRNSKIIEQESKTKETQSSKAKPSSPRPPKPASEIPSATSKTPSSPKAATQSVAGPSQRSGAVKSFNPTRGYGFITPDDGGTDIFVHSSDVEQAGLATLTDGQRVSFEIGPGRNNKLKAVNLKLVHEKVASQKQSGSQIPNMSKPRK